MARIGRNEPCPCGSGKKYKKCCWASDEEQRFPLIAEESHCDCGCHPLAEAEDFEDDETETAPFAEVFAQSEPDSDELYASFLDFQETLANQDDLAGCVTWIERIRREHPAAFEAEVAWYCRDYLEHALPLDMTTGIEQWLHPVFASADKEIDLVFPLVELFFYYGQTTPLLPAMQAAWPVVRDSDNVMPLGIEEFASLTAELLTYEFLSSGPAAPATLDDLLAAMQPYVAPERERLTQAMAHAAGRVKRVWHVQDFAGPGVQALDPDFTLFMQDFIHALHVHHGFPYSKAGMASGELESYLVSQRKPTRAARKKQSPTRDPGSWLLPQAATLDSHVGGLLDMFGTRVYRVAALWEAIPCYLQFLEEQALIDRTRCQAVASNLRSLQPDLVRAMANCSYDPRMKQACATCWQGLPGPVG